MRRHIHSRRAYMIGIGLNPQTKEKKGSRLVVFCLGFVFVFGGPSLAPSPPPPVSAFDWDLNFVFLRPLGPWRFNHNAVLHRTPACAIDIADTDKAKGLQTAAAARAGAAVLPRSWPAPRVLSSRRRSHHRRRSHGCRAQRPWCCRTQ
jgi:hypothetical protein